MKTGESPGSSRGPKLLNVLTIFNISEKARWKSGEIRWSFQRTRNYEKLTDNSIRFNLQKSEFCPKICLGLLVLVHRTCWQGHRTGPIWFSAVWNAPGQFFSQLVWLTTLKMKACLISKAAMMFVKRRMKRMMQSGGAHLRLVCFQMLTRSADLCLRSFFVAFIVNWCKWVDL